MWKMLIIKLKTLQNTFCIIQLKIKKKEKQKKQKKTTNWIMKTFYQHLQCSFLIFLAVMKKLSMNIVMRSMKKIHPDKFTKLVK